MIPHVDLNLASRPVRNNTLLWLVYLLAVIALGLFTFRNVVSFRENGAALVDLRYRVSKIERQMTDFELRERRANLEIGKYDLDSLVTQADKANDVIEWKAFSWTRLFNLLEQVQPYKVKMLSVRPVFYSAERRSAQQAVPQGAVPVNVEGVAADLRNFLELERSLLLDPHFDRVEPQGTTQLKNDETKFQLQFLYFPAMSVDNEQFEIPPVIEMGTPRAFAKAEAAAAAPQGVEPDGPAPDADGTPPAEEPAAEPGGTG